MAVTPDPHRLLFFLFARDAGANNNIELRCIIDGSPSGQAGFPRGWQLPPGYSSLVHNFTYEFAKTHGMAGVFQVPTYEGAERIAREAVAEAITNTTSKLLSDDAITAMKSELQNKFMEVLKSYETRISKLETDLAELRAEP